MSLLAACVRRHLTILAGSACAPYEACAAHRILVRARFLGVLAIVTMQCGCASYARYEPLKLNPESSETAFRSRSLSDPALSEYVRAHIHEEPLPEHGWDLSRLTLAAFFNIL